MFDKQQIKQIVKELYPESSVILFGSYARNEQTKHSDIDLLVLFENDIDIKKRLTIQAEIRKTLANLMIDADVLATGKNDFTSKSKIINHIFSTISKEGIML